MLCFYRFILKMHVYGGDRGGYWGEENNCFPTTRVSLTSNGQVSERVPILLIWGLGMQ